MTQSADQATTVQTDVLVIGWGSSYGPIGEAVRRVRSRGYRVARAHLRYINPMPATSARSWAGTAGSSCPR